MKKKISPTQRTEAWLREQGYVTGTVERHIHSQDRRGPGFKRDLFGCIDLIAIRPGRVLAVQSAGTDWSGHWRKIVEGTGRAGAMEWLRTGSPLLLIGWRELRTGYQPRVHWFLSADFESIFGVEMSRERSEEDWNACVI